MRKVVGSGLSRNGIEVFHSCYGSSRKILPMNKEGLVLYMPVDCNMMNIVADCSGKLNHGTRYGATITNNGKIGQGLQFDGIDDYVDCGIHSSLNIINEITVEAWVKNLGSPGTYKYLISRGGYQYHLYTGSSGNISFFIKDADGTGNKGVWDAESIWDGNWHYITGLADGSKVRLFVDGSEVGTSGNYSGSIVSHIGGTLHLGGIAPSSMPHFYKGKIDEIKIYNRALSPEEVLADYQREV